ncbi:acyl-CoA dehydratase activase-related protein, partial [Ruminococcaceae bacterium OttesenSCG-928-I18]|nr:acyl-CoA dehydratase activase-related protein [Ruminococcaceae bacterium OttesenSCG-928-I18]
LENISAGLAISVVKNALYKVIRASGPEQLGRNVVVQGGTFYNDAVLRAFEKEMGVQVIRPSIAGLMGAFGAALYGRGRAQGAQSAVLSQEELQNLTHSVKTAPCGLCTNHCNLTVNLFSGGRKFVSGNRCDRPVTKRGAQNPLDIYEYKQSLLDSYAPVPGRRGEKIGFPMGLNFFETLPFWHTFFTSLGFEVVQSPRSTRKLYFEGQATIPSDTVCYPAKLMHGHIHALAQQDDLDAIFYPCMSYNIDEGISDNCFNCPVVAYYPEVIKGSCSELEGKRFLYDYVGIHRPADFPKKMVEILRQYWPDIPPSEVQAASKAAYEEYAAHLSRVREKGAEIIARARAEGKPIIVLAGRPYHLDNEVNHGIEKLITAQGAAVVSEDAISHHMEKGPTSILNQWTYHARLYSAARYIGTQPDMNLVQLVSFGCGLDAVTTDEVREILHGEGKLYTQIKIDEIANLGAVNIRLRSLFAALEPEQHAATTETA